jgi:exonuclease SbcD
MAINVLHTADLHISHNAEKREETLRCVTALFDAAEASPPDVIVIAGDTVDELDGRIMLDSEAARVAIALVERAANIAPVVMVRGTKSHDREAPHIFRHLRTHYPVVVASEPMQVELWLGDGKAAFGPTGGPDAVHFAGMREAAIFTLLPSLDKQYLASTFTGGIKEANTGWRELAHDLCAGFGLVNAAYAVPRILVAHAMVTGAQFSTGQEAVGEDLELGVDTLRAANCDYVALGHVHKFQCFGKEICYSGSPGRLNFGEVEEKVALLVDVERGVAPVIRALPLPARRFVFADVSWDGPESIEAEFARVSAECAGAHVRFRYTIPEVERHAVDRVVLEKRLLDAGAVKVKVECQILPAQRQRAGGISQLSTLSSKVKKWGDVCGIDIPSRVLRISEHIESMTVEELLMEARDDEKRNVSKRPNF